MITKKPINNSCPTYPNRKIMRTAFLIISVFISASCFSQNNRDLAKAAYLNASDYYDNQNYSECVVELKSAISYLDTTNVRIQYLLSKAYFQVHDYNMAKEAVNSFFSFTPPVDDAYREILKISEQIDAFLKQQQAELAAKKAEEDSWSNAKNRDTRQSYQDYLNKYATSNHSQQAKVELDRCAWGDVIRSGSIDAYRKYQNDFPYGKHVSDAKAFVKEYEKQQDMRVNPNKYMINACLEFDAKLMQKLIEYGAMCAVNVKEKIGENSVVYYDPITYMIENSYSMPDWETIVKLTKLCLDKGANVNKMVVANLRDPNRGWDKYIGEWLIQENINEQNQQYIFRILKLYIEHGMDVNQDDGTPLRTLVRWHSSEINCFEMIKYMLDKGANPKLEKHYYTSNLGGISGKYKSPLSIAKKDEKKDLVKLFKAYK
jgi:hypothetical protein